MALDAAGALLLADEPTFVPRNGMLKGWEATKDNETLHCRDPTIFIRVKQIECEQINCHAATRGLPVHIARTIGAAVKLRRFTTAHGQGEK